MHKTKDPAVFSQQIEAMFGAIAPRYDFLNWLLSCGQDRHWRKSAVNLLDPREGACFLDVATGTADVALEIAARVPGNIRVFGLDISTPMLELGKLKIGENRLEQSIFLQKGRGEDLPFADDSFDGVITAFGIRNFSNVGKGLEEIRRVLKRDGKAVILEFSHPTQSVLGLPYKVYFDHILPWVGKTISGHRNAYSYLPQSVARFPVRDEFVRLMNKAGFQEVTFRDLTFGIVTLYLGKKND